MKIYTASKINRALLWYGLRDAWTEHEFTARWVDHVVTGKEASPLDPDYAREVWIEDEEDIKAAEVVLVIGDFTEPLRGALVEAGMGIAFGKRVIVVGSYPDYGSWQYHPSVWRVPSLSAARALLQRWNEE